MKPQFKIILFYKFVDISDPDKLKSELKELCASLNLKGRVLLAEEGINSTLEGTNENIDTFKKEFRKIKAFRDVVFKESEGTGVAFSKLQVKVRPEVVTLGVGKLNVQKDTAKKISAEELNRLYENKEDFVILDLRNDFEIQAGYFEKTVNPRLDNFRDLPDKLPQIADLKDKKVIAVCTGGIRCEKATPLLKKEGFSNLYQLEDGIHTYMAKYPGKNFKGSLFVFDNRMTTPVVDGQSREIVGSCVFCGTKSEDFYSDDSVRPSKKVICCSSCIKDHSQLRSCLPETLVV